MKQTRELIISNLLLFEIDLRDTYSEKMNIDFQLLGIDSIKLVSVVTNLCDELDIDLLDFSDDELINLANLENLEQLIKNKQK